MRGQLLERVLNDLRVQIGASLTVGHNINVRESHVNALRKTQEWLWDDYAWPQLRVERQIPIQAGQRFYSPPNDVHVDRIERVEFFTDGYWCRLEPGIDGRHFAAWNSDLDERSWPVVRWRIAEGGEGDGEQIELWPIPDANADDATRDGYLKITGIRNLNPFRDNDDKLDLDDQLVVLYTAADLIQDPKSAQLKLAKARNRDARLRGAMQKRTRFNMFSTRVRDYREIGRPVVAHIKTAP